MKKSEVSELIKAIAVFYQNSEFNKMDKERMLFSIDCWFACFYDTPKNIAFTALKSYVLKNAFPPTVSDLNREINEIKTPSAEKLTMEEGWGQVREGMQKFGYYRQDKFLESLSPVVREVVEILGIENLCTSENTIADRAHFFKMFESATKRRKEAKLIPESLRQKFKEISGENTKNIPKLLLKDFNDNNLTS